MSSEIPEHHTTIDISIAITVLGTGQMGGLAARRLEGQAKQRMPKTALSRARGHLESFGIVVHRNAKGATASADIVVSKLADGVAVAAVFV